MTADGARSRVPIGEAFRFAWSAFRRQVPYFVALLLGMVGSWGLLETLVIGFGMPPGRIDHLLLHLGFLWSMAFFDAGFVQLSLDLYDEQPPVIRRIAAGIRTTTMLLGARLLLLIVTLTGLALLIVPGLFVMARYGLAPYTIVDRRTTTLRGLRGSSRATAGVRGRLMGLAGLLVLLNLFGASLMGLGLIVTIPMTYLVLGFVYRRLTHVGSAPSVE